MKTNFLIRPMDWVAFGPPRPTSAGESHDRTTEVPNPTALQGIVRTALLIASGNDLTDRSRAAQNARDALVGKPDGLLPNWQLRGPFLTEILTNDEKTTARPWLPVPRFLLRSPQGPLMAQPIRSPLVNGKAAALNDLSPDSEPWLLAQPRENATEPLDGWLSPRGLRWALSGADEHGPWVGDEHAPKLPPFVKQEKVTGLEIDSNTGTAKDGMLYFGDVLRFAYPSGFAGWLDAPLPAIIAPDALTRGSLCACGWKSKPAVLEPLPKLDPDFEFLLQGKHLPERVAEEQAFFLVALTPVPCSTESNVRLAVENDVRRSAVWPAGVEIRVLASMTGRPRVIGGIEMASKRPRPNRSYWSAGSAWFFVLRGGGSGDEGAAARARALRVLNDAHVLGPKNDASFGYGHTLVGVGPKLNNDMLRDAWNPKEGGS